jgi:hypothetical protein
MRAPRGVAPVPVHRVFTEKREDAAVSASAPLTAGRFPLTARRNPLTELRPRTSALRPGPICRAANARLGRVDDHAKRPRP